MILYCKSTSSQETDKSLTESKERLKEKWLKERKTCEEVQERKSVRAHI